MIIVTDINFHPKLIQELDLIDDSLLYYKDHGLKHPAGILNVGIREVEDALNDFFVLYKNFTIEDLTADKDNGKITGLLKAYKTFLYSLKEYFDDCINIVKTLVPIKPNHKPTVIQYSWLEINEPALVEQFYKNIKEYKQYLDHIVNELKHNNAILSSIIFFNKRLGIMSPGYYVSNVKDDKYQAVERVHNKFYGAETGFSFGRDIRYNIYNVYFLAEEIGNILRTLNVKYSERKPELIKANETKYKLYSDIMELSRAFFPDEYSKPIPSVAILKDDTLKLEYPSRLSLKHPRLLDEMVTTMSPDGKTAIFAMPYYTPRNNE